MQNNLTKITKILDQEFNLQDCPPDMPLHQVFPREYSKQKFSIQDYVEPKFQEKYMGLMLNNSSDGTFGFVVFCVFFGDEIVKQLREQRISKVLVITHHPMEFESCGAGFILMKESSLQFCRENEISVYVLHNPLDVHATIATSQSIANALDLREQKRFDKFSIGFGGVLGELPEELLFDDFIEKCKIIFLQPEIHFEKRFDTVKKIGIIAGGGADVSLMKEALNLGCDTYLSGDYLNKVQNEYSKKLRQEFEKEASSLNLNLVECSHYSTESLVFLTEFPAYLENLGIKSIFIPQSDAWK